MVNPQDLTAGSEITICGKPTGLISRFSETVRGAETELNKTAVVVAVVQWEAARSSQPCGNPEKMMLHATHKGLSHAWSNSHV